MSRLLEGTEGFRYMYRTVCRSIPIEELARTSRAGTLRFVVDRYEVWPNPDENEVVYLEQLEKLLDLDENDDRGFYEADDHDTTAKDLFTKLVKTELDNTVDPLVEHFGETVHSISVVAAVQFRLDQDDWDPMLEYLNGRLPEDMQLTYDELRTFDSDCLSEYDPKLHEADRDDGTLFLQRLLEHEQDDGLAYLGFRILVHAIQHDLEILDVDDEPRWQRELYGSDDE